MNSIIEKQYPLFELYQALRSQLMEQLNDADLAFNPGGENVSLGKLCREIGEVEQSYIDSFKSLEQNFDYRHPDPAISGSVARLQAWYGQLDDELKAAVGAFSEEDLRHKVVDRGGDFQIPPGIQLEIYKEALVIFYGKVDIYLKLMGKERSSRWAHWIG